MSRTEDYGIELLPDMPLTGADVAACVTSVLTDSRGTLVCRDLRIDPTSTDWLGSLAVIAGARIRIVSFNLPSLRPYDDVYERLLVCLRRLDVISIRAAAFTDLLTKLRSMEARMDGVELRYENAVYVQSRVAPYAELR